MQVIKDENIKLNNTIVTLGKFDGNHIGHRALFDKAKRIKAESGASLSTVIFTFDVNPRSVFSETADSSVLYTNAERFDAGEDEDIDYLLVWPFTKKNMSMQPGDFVKDVLCAGLGTRHIVVGEDFRFGKDRKGDVPFLRSLQDSFGFEVSSVPEIKYKGKRVSSTWIKDEIAQGNLDDANHMLGRAFSVSGRVVFGKHLGQSLGFPTINLTAPYGKIIPPDGVYATKTTVEGRTYRSMTNIGVRPTFENGAFRNIETNIFDFDGDIYGKTVRIEFYRFIRAEKTFENASGLVEELKKNRAQITAYFADTGK